MTPPGAPLLTGTPPADGSPEAAYMASFGGRAEVGDRKKVPQKTWKQPRVDMNISRRVRKQYEQRT